IADFPFSFTAAAGQTFVVVIHEITANAGCPGYGFEVEGLPGGCPTPPTALPTATQPAGGSATPTCVAGGGTPGIWTTTAPRSIDAYGPGGAGSSTNFYVGGGYSFSLGGYTPNFGSYNPSTNAWASLTAVPSTGEMMSMVYAPLNNKVYAFGGIDCVTIGTAYNNTRIYDVATGLWSAGAVMPIGAQQMASGYWNGKIYLQGGYTDCFISTAQSALQIYDVATNTWTAGAPMPEAIGGGIGGVINGVFYVAGGRDSVNTNRSTVYAYTIATNTWATVASLPTGVNVAASAIQGGKLWVFGGGNPFVGESASLAASQPGNNKGKLDSPNAMSITQIYDPVANSWAPGPNMNTARSFPSGGSVGNYVVTNGGYTGSSSTASTEVNLTTGGGCVTPGVTNTPGVTATPTCVAGGAQVIQDPSFEGGTPSAFWTEKSTNFGTPLCDVASCGNGGGTAGPRTGDWWAWFGGTASAEDGAVSQTVNIPAGTSTLQFYLWIGAHSGNGAADYIRALVNGVEVFRATDASTAYDAGYTLVSVDVSAQAGSNRIVRIEEHNDAGSAVFNASVDDVTLTTAGGGCGTPGPASPTPTCVPSAAGWTPGANFNDAAGNVRGLGVYFPPDGKFYAIGGRNADTAGSDMLNPHIYDPATDTWSTASATIVPDNQVNNMGGGVLTVSGTPMIIVVGGNAAGATGASNHTRYYNPATDTWTLVATDPWPATTNALPGGFAVVNNKLYILGGFVNTVGMTQEIWEYDPALAAGSRWTLKTATLPVGRGYIPTTAIGGTIYMAGGSEWDGTTLLDSDFSYKYDPATDTITPIATIPRLTAETRAVNMAGKMWVLGGGRDAPNPSNQVDIYDPVANSWTTGTPFITARRNFPADTDGAGKIYITGGYAPTAPTNSTEIYSSGSGCPTPGPGSPTTTSTSTNTPVTPGPTNTSPPQPTNTVQGGSPTSTPTQCVVKFEDVDPLNEFYGYIEYLYCRDVIQGYNTVPPCITPGRTCFKPANNTTRGQLAKIVIRAFEFPIDTTGGPHFTDVPVGSTFYTYIETGYNMGLFTGYADGTYRPNAWVTRGQIAKIVVNAAIIADPANWILLDPSPNYSFTDVPPSNVFYRHVETAYAHNLMSGYPCGGPGEPCDSQNRNYLRVGNPATRQQISKVVYLAITYPPFETNANR
ncbi:MAG: kelch repeat-containing protein, partial [Chloroflexia bacterium]